MKLTAVDEPRLRTLIETGRTLIARLDLEGLLETVLVTSREVTGARYAAIGILDEEGRQLDRFLTLGIDADTQATIGELPTGGGVLGELIRRPAPLRLSEIGAHPRSCGFPPGHPPMRTFLGVPILIHGETWGSLYLTEKQGGEEFDEADEAALAVLADWTALAVENARLYEGLARRRDQVEEQRDRIERSARALAVMSDIARSVGGETDIDRILELIIDRGRALVEARVLLILLRDGEELVVAATAGEVAPGIFGSRVGVEGSPLGAVLRDLRVERLGAGNAEASLDPLGISAEAEILVPLAFRGEASGVLVALDRTVDGPGFTAEDEQLLSSFAASAATAVATARSVAAERLRESIEAAEQERKHWARELHDETLQALGGLRMLYSTALRGELAPDELRATLREGIEMVDAEIDNVSALIAELRPAALDEVGLIPALHTLAERKGHEGGLTVDVLARLGGARLPAETESTAYRLVQEALNNVVKHAGATRAEALLEGDGAAIEITVRDDGRGFDPATTTSGFGLTGMRERVELAGGELRIDAAVGRGTTVSATIPVRAGGPRGAGRHRSSSS